MNFVQSIINSIYNPAYYRKLLKEPLKNALKYFFLLSVLLAVIHSLDLLPSLMGLQRQAPTIVEQFISYVPADLQVQIKDGQASTNAPEPYFIPLDPNNPLDASASGQHLLVIDTKTPFSNSQLKDYHAVAWLTKDTLFYPDNNRRDELKTFSLSKVKDVTINQSSIRQITDHFKPWYNFIAPILFIVLLIGLVIGNAFNLLYLLLLAGAVWVLAKLFRQTLTYRQSYVVSIHAITLSLLLNLALNIASRWFQVVHYPLSFSILALAVVAVNLFIKTKNVS